MLLFYSTSDFAGNERGVFDTSRVRQPYLRRHELIRERETWLTFGIRVLCVCSRI